MSTGQRELLCGREGNRRSGVVLAKLHRLCGISIYGLNGLRKGDEHPAYTPLRNFLPTAINFHSLLTCCKAGLNSIHYIVRDYVRQSPTRLLDF